MTANTIYSDFINNADVNNNIRNNKKFLDYISHIASSVEQLNSDNFYCCYSFVGSNIISYKKDFLNSNLEFNISNGFTVNNLGVKRYTRNFTLDTSLLQVPFSPINTTNSGLSFFISSFDDQQASTDDIDCGVDGVYFSYYPAGARNMVASFQGFGSNNLINVPGLNNGIGVYCANYLTESEIYKNGIKLNGTLSTIPGSKPTNNINLFGRNVAGINTNGSVKGYNFFAICKGLTQDKISQFSHNIRVGQGILNR
jgi:hypothetical protein